jgi:hypothetical protein
MPTPEKQPGPDDVELLASWAKTQAKAKLEAIEARVKAARAAYDKKFQNPVIDAVTVKLKRPKRRKRRKKGGGTAVNQEPAAPDNSKFMKNGGKPAE